MDDVKQQDHHLVKVTGVVRKSALIEPGVKIGNRDHRRRRQPGGGVGRLPPAPPEPIPVMDVWSVQSRATSCGG